MPGQETSTTCPSCGATDQEEAFCANCGAPLLAQTETPVSSDGEHGDPAADKVCPACAETVKAGAVICRFCGHDFRKALAAPSEATEQPASAQPADGSGGQLKWGGLPTEAPSWLERRGQRSLRSSIVWTSALFLVVLVATEFLYFPRFIFWTVACGIMVLGLASTGSAVGAFARAFYPLAVIIFLADYVLGRIALSMRDIPGSFPLDGYRLLAYLGSVSLAFFIVAYLSPQVRKAIRSFTFPNQVINPARLGAVVVVAALAAVPVARSFTGEFSFGVVGITPTAANPFPGYPTTSDVKQYVQDRIDEVAGTAVDLEYLDCEYIFPQAGPPPLWGCSTKATANGETVYLDDLQITGRQDGTFECYDADGVIC